MSDSPEAALLTVEQRDEFRARGFLCLRRFYDVEREIAPIQRDIHTIIEILRRKHGLPPTPGPFEPARFDAGYADLLAADRRYAGEVYDAVKHVPALLRLVASPRNEALFRKLRGTDLPGIAAGGYGIRIDNPGEERFRADWHQEYPTQLRSVDGITLWTSLVPVTEDMGPVRFCPGSQRLGMLRVHTRDPDHPEKTGAYGLILENRDEIVGRFEQEAPLVQPGDLILIDYAVLHASGHNRSKRSRWTLQMRWFNFRDPIGTKSSWRGGVPDGSLLAVVHPELVADAPTPTLRAGS
jgi:hypothetical protein